VWLSGSQEMRAQLKAEKDENEAVERWNKRLTLLGDFCKVEPPPPPFLCCLHATPRHVPHSS
jgi:hypothetical protein